MGEVVTKRFVEETELERIVKGQKKNWLRRRKQWNEGN